ncbi:bifunctional (p)ppGpp synthetase/guanosine-3',5'-bis(diphosphate) 3'-pyrophosphohydrolase [Candidatus Woesearchaeota archaeon]|nr:bifunctional (p)ppGpp synthetase/guanosine-3',5'-bis(diphosphate) 3'-pyrophosphohydrolase [Candidatus Woesearchaeota archaeon]
MNIKTLITELKKSKIKISLALIKKAYLFAEFAHQGQKRASNEPYIKHSLNVAFILVKLGMDEETIVAGLLHDILEDTKITSSQLEKEFGKKTASLVEGVTKISNLKYSNKEETNIENLRKMLLATSKDFRVIIIKLADRLHNMRTLEYLPKEDQIRIAKETQEIYAPLAYRLGISSIKAELEDLSFKYLNPKEYEKILRGILTTRKHREMVLFELKDELEKELKKHNIDARLQYRVKNIYSIYKKIHERNYELENIRDLIALRVITKTIRECYEVLGIVHQLWKPIEGGVRDYIAVPKSNMYQSIHSNVITNHGLFLEVQIRTEEMHKLAESGIAAHWKYKGLESDEKFEKRLEWVKEIVNSEDKSEQLLETLKIELFGDEIFVFTPKGKVIEIPIKSTPVDFAYHLHSDIGDRCVGAKVNGNFVPLNYELKNGDVIEIITQKNHKPSRDWLKFVKTSKARQKIKHYIRLTEKIPVQRFNNKYDRLSKFKSILEIKDMKSVAIKFAHCCNPMPKDKIIALISNSNITTVHKTDCSILKTKKGRKAQASWIQDFEASISINVRAEDRLGLLADLMKIFSNSGINVEKANAHLLNNKVAECNFELKPKNLDNLSRIIDNLKNVFGVKKVSIIK